MIPEHPPGPPRQSLQVSQLTKAQAGPSTVSGGTGIQSLPDSKAILSRNFNSASPASKPAQRPHSHTCLSWAATGLR